ncbi:hypothetical protein JCM16814_17060 [Desulfobaculum senezii]
MLRAKAMSAALSCGLSLRRARGQTRRSVAAREGADAARRAEIFGNGVRDRFMYVVSSKVPESCVFMAVFAKLLP